eukprot:scaffold662_cov364-Pavlova_lutheri.AAC.22
MNSFHPIEILCNHGVYPNEHVASGWACTLRIWLDNMLEVYVAYSPRRIPRSVLFGLIHIEALHPEGDWLPSQHIPTPSHLPGKPEPKASIETEKRCTFVFEA